MTLRSFHMPCGIGGDALGFARAGFEVVGAIDSDPSACRDFEQLVGVKATVADIALIGPHELRDASTGRPDVAFLSPPCKAFSGCLPSARVKEEKYQRLSDLSFRAVWLAVEAWTPPLIVFENVPRILSRGRQWLDMLTSMLHAYGYAVMESTHDCGELGGLAQHRRRFLLVARHMEQIPEFLYRPALQRVRSIGEVLGALPVPLPGSSAGGPLHRLPRMSALNWLRLALIPASGDWRDLPESVAISCRPRAGVLGVEGWGSASGSVIGESRPDNGAWSVADPRVTCTRREGSMGVTPWDGASASIIAWGSPQNGPWQVADPRLDHDPRPGSWGVLGWASPSHTIRSYPQPQNGEGAVADPRIPEVEGEPIDLDSREPIHLVIRAADGTWHRPLTTLELALLQGFPSDLQLCGSSHSSWRQRIGNAVPPPAAEAIARECRATLESSRAGRLHLSGQPVWVEEPPC